MEPDGRELIFLISQPRSGSTLLQHILAGHPAIHTTPEPWLLLPLAYTLKSRGIEAEYRQRNASTALSAFLDEVPDGYGIYRRGIRDLALAVYRETLAKAGKSYFLDKTPRYYLIVDDLVDLFPASKSIVLLRHPLAVLSSMLDELDGDAATLGRPDRRTDILEAPHLLIRALERHGDRLLVLRYEDLVAQPAEEVEKACVHIGIDFDDEMLSYGDRLPQWSDAFGDPKLYEHDAPVARPDAVWLARFDTPFKRHLAASYMHDLGRATVERLGYSFDGTMEQLERLGPQRRSFLVPWSLIATPLEQTPRWKRAWLSFGRSLTRLGPRETVRRYLERRPKGDTDR